MPKSRVNGVIGVLGFAAVILVFAVLLGGTVYQGLREVFSYRPADAIVVSFQAADELAPPEWRAGQIDYRYTFDGKNYAGACPPSYSVTMPRHPYAALKRPWNQGDRLIAFVDPSDPSVSTLEPRVEAFPFGIAIFILPIVLVFASAFLGLKSAQQRQVGNAVMKSAPIFVAYILVSAVAAFTFMFTSDYLGSTAAPLVGALLLVFIPRVLFAGREALLRAFPSGMGDNFKQGIILCIVAIALGGGLAPFAIEIVGTWRQLARIHAAYQTTTGTVQRAGVVEDPGSGRRGRTTYRGVIEFKYALNDRSFTGNRFAAGVFFRESQTQTAASARVAEHPPGSHVIVYYDPADPEHSVLDPHVPFAMWFVTPLVALFAVIWAALGITAWKKIRSHADPVKPQPRTKRRHAPRE